MARLPGESMVECTSVRHYVRIRTGPLVLNELTGEFSDDVPKLQASMGGLYNHVLSGLDSSSLSTVHLFVSVLCPSAV